MRPVLQGLGIGCVVLVVTACWPFMGRRRAATPHRDPFDFHKYTGLEWFFVAVGFVVIVVSVIQLVPLLRHATRAGGPLTHRELARAGMPRTIYELLLGIAATDGRIDADEREVVAQVVTQRLPDIVTPQDLQNWKQTVEPPRDPVQLARNLAPVMTEHERAALWEWCREVAAVDGPDKDEHDEDEHDEDEHDEDEDDVLRRIRAVLKPIDVTTWRRQGS